MKLRNLSIFTLIIALCGSFFTVSTKAQIKNEEEYKTKLEDPVLQADGSYKSGKLLSRSQQPEDTYLAKFHAIDLVSRLMTENLEQIYLLKVIVSNFKDKKDWNTKYQQAYLGYKLAMETFYRRNVIYARLYFEENKKFLDELMKSIAEFYRDDTKAMLSRCATEIMNLHLDEKTRSDPNKTEELFTNQMRLRISYGQFDDGRTSFIDHNYVNSILHYRVAKSYAIKILEDLSKPEEREKNKKEFSIHKADNLNRIYEERNISSRGTTTPKTK